MYRISIFAVIAVILCCNCTDINQTAGGGTETSNGRIAVLISENSISINGKTTFNYGIFDTGYSPSTLSGYADSLPSGIAGETVLDNIPDGTYNLFIWDTETGFSNLIRSIHIPASSPVSMGIKMQLPGLITGVVQDSNGITPDSALVEIPGSPIFSYTYNACQFTLENVPPANLHLKIIAWTDDIITGQESQMLNTSVEVLSGKESLVRAILEKPIP